MGKWIGIKGERLLLSSSEHIEIYGESEVKYKETEESENEDFSGKVCTTSGHGENLPSCRILKEFEKK